MRRTRGTPRSRRSRRCPRSAGHGSFLGHPPAVRPRRAQVQTPSAGAFPAAGREPERAHRRRVPAGQRRWAQRRAPHGAAPHRRLARQGAWSRTPGRTRPLRPLAAHTMDMYAWLQPPVLRGCRHGSANLCFVRDPHGAPFRYRKYPDEGRGNRCSCSLRGRRPRRLSPFLDSVAVPIFRPAEWSRRSCAVRGML